MRCCARVVACLAVAVALAALAVVVAYEVVEPCHHAPFSWSCVRLPAAWPWDQRADVLESAALYGTAVALARALAAAGACACPSSPASPDAANASFDGASLFSKLTFWWVTPTLNAALRQGKLELEDLPMLPKADEPVRLGRLFERAWARGRRGPYKLLLSCSFTNQRAVFVQSFSFG